MIKLTLFKTARSRLLVAMAIIVLPLAVMNFYLAAKTYSTVTKGLEESQLQVTSNYSSRTRIWFRGALRGAIGIAAALVSTEASPERCQTIADSALNNLDGFLAIRLSTGGGVSCRATRNPEIAFDELDRISERLRALPPVQSWIGTQMANARYDVVTIGKRNYIAIYGDQTTDGAQWSATTLINPDLLDQAFELGSGSDVIAALMKRGGQVIVAAGADEKDLAWLPKTEFITTPIARRQLPDAQGESHYFVSHLVIAPDLYVLTRFNSATEAAAFHQFLFLSVLPLITLLLLYFTYANIVQSDFGRWVKEIENAVKASAIDDRPRLAPISNTMPSDIRRVAEAFNQMVIDTETRETTLTKALGDNKFLMRELHHRVKNSLQTIQSFLALSRRMKSGADRRTLAEIEARVQVISTAYRLALTENTMNPVPLKPFADAIFENMLATLPVRSQRLTRYFDMNASIVLDRAIPFGLALVEAVVSALNDPEAHLVHVSVLPAGNGALELTVTSDGFAEARSISEKILAGLAEQLAATSFSTSDNTVLRWVFTL